MTEQFAEFVLDRRRLINSVIVGVSMFVVATAVARAGGDEGWIEKPPDPEVIDSRGYRAVRVDLERGVFAFVEDFANELRRELRKAGMVYIDMRRLGPYIFFEVSKRAHNERAAKVAEQIVQGAIVSQQDDQIKVSFDEATLRRIRLDELRKFVSLLKANDCGDEARIHAHESGCILVVLGAPSKRRECRPLPESYVKLAIVPLHTELEPNAKTLPPGFEIVHPSPRVDLSHDRQSYVVSKRIVVSGENIVDASVDLDGGQPVVVLTFDMMGERSLARAADRIQGRPLAIVFGKLVVGTIPAGQVFGRRTVLRGDLNGAQAKRLVAYLRAGVRSAGLLIPTATSCPLH